MRLSMNIEPDAIVKASSLEDLKVLIELAGKQIQLIETTFLTSQEQDLAQEGRRLQLSKSIFNRCRETIGLKEALNIAEYNINYLVEKPNA